MNEQPRVFVYSFLVLLKLHLLSLARTSPINSIKDRPQYRQGAIKMSNTVKNTTSMTQDMIPSTAFGSCCTKTFRLFLGVATPTE
jgi:hypothetical protein